MSNKLFQYVSIFVVVVLILSGCQLFGNPFVSNPKINKVIKSGNFVEDVELQTFPLFNCQSQVQNTLSVERSRTLERSVHLNVDPKIDSSIIPYIGNIVQEVGIEYGWTGGTTITDSGGLLLNAAPQAYPIYTIAWRQRWEQGSVEIVTKDGTEKIPYEFLSEAHPEIQSINNIQCDNSGFGTATAFARILTPQATKAIIPSESTPTNFPTVTPKVTYSWEFNNNDNLEGWGREGSILSNQLKSQVDF